MSESIVPLMTAIHELEGRLVTTWIESERFRALWTPDPDEMVAPRSKALARACRVAEGPDWSSAVVMELGRSGDLQRLWTVDEPPWPFDGYADPLPELERLRELWGLARLHSSLSRVVLGLRPGCSLSESQSAVREALSASEVSGGAVTFTDSELMRMAYEQASRPRGSASRSGFHELDELVGGIRPGHIWAVGAQTNWGKSSFLLALLDEWLRAGRRPLYLTCEDAPELLATRLLCRRGKLPGGAARDGRLSGEQLQRAVDVVEGSGSSGDAPLFLDGRGRAVESLAGDVRALVRSQGIDLVLLDYIGCVTTKRQTQDRRAEINHIGRTMTDAVKTSGIAGVFASQLTGDDKLRESRDLEHAAEVVLIGKGNGRDEPRSLFVAKNKTGPRGVTIDLGWDNTSGSFYDPVAPAMVADDLGGAFWHN